MHHCDFSPNFDQTRETVNLRLHLSITLKLYGNSSGLPSLQNQYCSKEGQGASQLVIRSVVFPMDVSGSEQNLLVIGCQEGYSLVFYSPGFNYSTRGYWCHQLHHHHVVPPARISLTLSRHFSQSFIASGRSSGLHPVSSHSCRMYVRAGRPAFDRPYAGVHRSTSLMSSSLLLQQWMNSYIKRYNKCYNKKQKMNWIQ